MEIGTEISQKIRAAIKAKLVDLGAYVDDELPDYIMVMVANKKTQAQMTEDLNLFLGNNTDRFTLWLNALLNKLQAITADSSQPPTAQETEQQLRVVEESQAEFSSASKVKAKPRKSQEQAAEPEPPPKEEPELEPEININVEQDEFAEEAQAAKEADLKKQEEKDKTEKQKKKQSPPRVKERIIQKKSPPVTQRVVSSSGGDIVEERVVSIVQPKQPPRAIVKGSVIKKPQRPRVAAAGASSRRRGPGSVLASVVKHDVEEEEEGYDPYNPAIGKVASVIRVTERKSSVPQSMQATKSLLMKAMTEAKVSVERTKRQPLEPAIVRPIMQRIGTAARMTSTPRAPEQLFSRSKREEIFQRLKADIGEDSTEGEEEDSSLFDDTTDSISYSVAQSIESPDSRLVQPADPPSEFDESDVLTLQESTDDLDLPDVSDISVDKESNYKSKPDLPRAASPKFVVTLEGVDPSDLGIEGGEEEEEEEVPRNVRTGKRRGPRQQQFTVNLEEEDEDGDSPMKQQRLQERCRFWPGCKNGDQCPYHHPTVQCKAFPKCTYGDRCLFIHPNCKFDAKCTRADCPFTHASKRGPRHAPAPMVLIQPIKVPMFEPMQPPQPRPSHPSQVKCRFFPRCTNMTCPFLHPKPCRFGISCNNKATCMFAHPDLPGKGSLKWQAAKPQASKQKAEGTT